MKICVVGIGYVGLVTAGCLAEAGNDVVCVDNDEKKIEGLKMGQIPIFEPGLTEIIQHNEKLGRLHFTTDLKFGVDNSQIIFLAVGTPSAPDGSCDISAVLSVSGKIAENMSEYRIIATKSTVPVGTYKKVIDIINQKIENRKHVVSKVEPSKIENPLFDYVSNPEFLKEGSAVEDYLSPDRIIIGTTNPTAQKKMAQLYSPFMRKGSRILFMDTASAEMTKYAANVMLATRISFMNEISALCEKVGADVELVRQGIGSDSRIGRSFLFAGVGFGGSCLPKDIRALIHTGSIHGVEMTIAKAAQKVNINQQERFAARIKEYFKGQVQTVLAVWGLSFKAKTDDVRESPAIYCIKKFLDCGMQIKAYDPAAPAPVFRQEDAGGKFQTFQNGYDALETADALVIFTDWQEFRNPDFEVIKGKLKKPVIFDGRNLYDPETVKSAGIEYHSIGREIQKSKCKM